MSAGIRNKRKTKTKKKNQKGKGREGRGMGMEIKWNTENEFHCRICNEYGIHNILNSIDRGTWIVCNALCGVVQAVLYNKSSMFSILWWITLKAWIHSIWNAAIDRKIPKYLKCEKGNRNVCLHTRFGSYGMCHVLVTVYMWRSLLVFSVLFSTLFLFVRSFDG